MKNIIQLCVVLLLVATACKSEKTDKSEAKNAEVVAENYSSFGDKINDESVMTSDEMLAKFENMNVGDTINAKFASTINEVCSKKGCWMKLPLGSETETMVRFKDYGFFMPLDAAEKEVIVAGKAFVKETSVDELRHYAEDAGKTEEEIALITEPKKEFAFEANGVLMKK